MAKTERLKKLQEKFTDFDAFITLKSVNLRYLVDFKGEGATLLVTKDKVKLYVNEMYYEQAQKDCPEIDIVPVNRNWMELLARDLKREKIKRLAFEPDISFSTYRELSYNVTGIELKPIGNLVDSLRAIKDDEEISLIRKAAEIADLAFIHLKTLIKPGIREQDLVAEFDYFVRKRGAKTSFEPIILYGETSSLPHGSSSSREIKNEGILLIDYGAMYNGYCSDATRTFYLGKVSREYRRLYNIVLNAQEEAEAAIKPGITTGEIDKIAREIINKEGFGDKFIHSTGHGVGLEIHEYPSLSEGSNVTLEKGMIITVEPGIYIKGFGGIRIEDLILVTDNGGEIITRVSKDFEFKGGNI